MPGFNQNGPMGQGAMTGRKMGKCTNFGVTVKQESIANTNPTETSPENTEPRMLETGRGMGNGRGMGMGRKHRFRNGQ